MQIEIELDSPARHYQPGDMVQGEVRLRSSTPVRVEGVEVRAIPSYDDLTEVSGTLSRGCTVQGTTTLPLAIRLPMSGQGDDASWKILVEVEGEESDWNASIDLTVETPAARKVAANIGALIFALPALGVGALGMGFAIGGVPGKVIPEGVLWFAFVAGVCALLVARAIMGTRDRNQAVSWLGVPITLALLALGVAALYITMIQPDLAPVKAVFRPGPIHSLLSMLDGADVRARLMSFIAAGFLLPIAIGVITRRPVSPGLQAEVALTVVSTTLAIIVLGGVAGGLATTGRVPTIVAEMWLAALMGVISVSGTFTRPTWTAAPALTFAAGLVPLALGLFGLYASFKPGSGAPAAERIVAGVVALWGVIVMYRGGRNVLVAMSTGSIDVAISPTPVSVGESITVSVSVDPRREVVLEAISGVLRCQRIYSHTVGSDRRTETQTIHKDRRSVELNEQLQSGTPVKRELRFVIPVGLPTSDSSSTSGTFWSLDVKVKFAGSADWASSYPIQVVYRYD